MIPGEVIVGAYRVTHPITIDHTQQEMKIYCLAHKDNCVPMEEIKQFEQYLANASDIDVILSGGLVPQANTTMFLQVSDGNKFYYGYLTSLTYKLDENADKFIEYEMTILKYKAPNQDMGLYQLQDGDEIGFEDGWEDGFENWKVCTSAGSGIYGTGQGAYINAPGKLSPAQLEAMGIESPGIFAIQSTNMSYINQLQLWEESQEIQKYLEDNGYSDAVTDGLLSSESDDTYLNAVAYTNVKVYKNDSGCPETTKTTCPVCGRKHGCIYPSYNMIKGLGYYNLEYVIDHNREIEVAVFYVTYRTYFEEKKVDGRIMDYRININGKLFNIPWKEGHPTQAIFVELDGAKHLWFTAEPNDLSQLPGTFVIDRVVLVCKGTHGTSGGTGTTEDDEVPVDYSGGTTGISELSNGIKYWGPFILIKEDDPTYWHQHYSTIDFFSFTDGTHCPTYPTGTLFGKIVVRHSKPIKWLGLALSSSGKSKVLYLEGVQRNLEGVQRIINSSNWQYYLIKINNPSKEVIIYTGNNIGGGKTREALSANPATMQVEYIDVIHDDITPTNNYWQTVLTNGVVEKNCGNVACTEYYESIRTLLSHFGNNMYYSKYTDGSYDVSMEQDSLSNELGLITIDSVRKIEAIVLKYVTTKSFPAWIEINGLRADLTQYDLTVGKIIKWRFTPPVNHIEIKTSEHLQNDNNGVHICGSNYSTGEKGSIGIIYDV